MNSVQKHGLKIRLKDVPALFGEQVLAKDGMS